jgi:uncharacterized membrane protein
MAQHSAPVLKVASMHPDPRLERLLFFSDAVFAIAITLLIIDLHAPALPLNADDAAWLRALRDMLPAFGGFALSFIVIGSFWAAHHSALSLLVHFHPRLVWPNLLLLMAVAFLPFPTALIVTGSLAHIPFVVYALALLGTGLLKVWLIRRALRPDLLDPAVPPARIAVERRRTWILPAAAAVTAALAWVAPGWCNFAILVVIVVLRRVPWFRQP